MTRDEIEMAMVQVEIYTIECEGCGADAEGSIEELVRLLPDWMLTDDREGPLAWCPMCKEKE